MSVNPMALHKDSQITTYACRICITASNEFSTDEPNPVLGIFAHAIARHTDTSYSPIRLPKLQPKRHEFGRHAKIIEGTSSSAIIHEPVSTCYSCHRIISVLRCMCFAYAPHAISGIQFGADIKQTAPSLFINMHFVSETIIYHRRFSPGRCDLHSYEHLLSALQACAYSSYRDDSGCDTNLRSDPDLARCVMHCDYCVVRHRC